MTVTMKEEIVRKLEHELSLPIESERQVVYILVEIRKLMDRLGLRKDERFKPLRFLCNWAVHADVTRGYGRTVFELLHKNIDASMNGREPPAAEEFRYALSLLESRDSLLDFLRDHGLRQARIFDATDWALFLKHYLGVVAECPVVLEKTIQPCHHIIDVTLSGFDVPAQVAETMHPDDITLGVRWTFRFAGGLKFPFDIPLIFSHERAAPCQICASDDT